MMIDASGIRTGDNPPYELSDFYVSYPQFQPDAQGDSLIPEVVMQMYLDLANACIKEARWHKGWKVAIGWFIAHFLTLYAQGMVDPTSGAAGVIKAGQAQGLQTSVSVGDVSASTDYNTIASGINGWAQWKLTRYGQQLAGMGRLIGMGAMYIN